jgi:hypothetical protein
MSRWFRIDDDVIHDIKVQALPGDLFKGWINVLCIASKHGGRLPPLKAVAFALRVSEAKAVELIAKLVLLDLLDKDADGHTPHNWGGRQFITDSGDDTSPAGRTRKWREKKKAEAKCNAAVTRDVTRDVTLTRDGDVTDTSPTIRDRNTNIIKPEPEKEGTREVVLVPSGWPPDFFEQFWRKYPNKVDPSGARKKLFKAGRNGIEFATIMAGLDRYISKADDRHWCNPTTWINQSRWEEQHATVGSNNGLRTGYTRSTGHDDTCLCDSEGSQTRSARRIGPA